MKNIFTFFSDSENLNNTINYLFNNNYNINNISVISINKLDDIIKRINIDFKIKELNIKNNVNNLNSIKYYILENNKILIMTGPISNYTENKNIKEINTILSLADIDELDIKEYLDLLFNEKMLFIFPIIDKMKMI